MGNFACPRCGSTRSSAAESCGQRMRSRYAHAICRQFVVAHRGQYRAAAALRDFHLIAVMQFQLRIQRAVHRRHGPGTIMGFLQ